MAAATVTAQGAANGAEETKEAVPATELGAVKEDNGEQFLGKKIRVALLTGYNGVNFCGS